MPQRRGGFAVAKVDEAIYLLGGYADGFELDRVEACEKTPRTPRYLDVIGGGGCRMFSGLFCLPGIPWHVCCFLLVLAFPMDCGR